MGATYKGKTIFQSIGIFSCSDLLYLIKEYCSHYKTSGGIGKSAKNSTNLRNY